MKLLLNLYPKSWRARYEEEIAALIDQAPNTWRTAPDLIAGALKEQFNMQSFTRLALTLSLAGLAAGFLGSFAITPQFLSRALFQIERKGGGWQNMPPPAEAIARASANVLNRQSLVTIIANPQLNLYSEDRQHEPLEYIEDQMRRNIRISINPQLAKNSAAIGAMLAFTYKDPKKARDTVNVVISRLGQEVAAELRESAQTNRPSARIRSQFLDVIDPPNLPLNAYYPYRPKFAAAGFIAGLLAALLITLVRGRYRRPTLTPA